MKEDGCEWMDGWRWMDGWSGGSERWMEGGSGDGQRMEGWMRWMDEIGVDVVNECGGMDGCGCEGVDE